MMEYQRVWDDSDKLELVNTEAKEGWYVIASLPDERRGTMFIMARNTEIGAAMRESLTVSGSTQVKSGLPADYWETAQ